MVFTVPLFQNWGHACRPIVSQSNISCLNTYRCANSSELLKCDLAKFRKMRLIQWLKVFACWKQQKCLTADFGVSSQLLPQGVSFRSDFLWLNKYLRLTGGSCALWVKVVIVWKRSEEEKGNNTKQWKNDRTFEKKTKHLSQLHLIFLYSNLK